MHKVLMYAVVVTAIIGCATVRAPGETMEKRSGLTDNQRAISAIAKDIEALKSEFPQLAEFSVKTHSNLDRLHVSYAYKTHEPKRRAGWLGAVPHPDSDGIWFYIDIHDANSMAQIHTQPVTGRRLRFGKDHVQFLILEGSATQRISEHLERIMKKHGVQFGVR